MQTKKEVSIKWLVYNPLTKEEDILYIQTHIRQLIKIINKDKKQKKHHNLYKTGRVSYLTYESFIVLWMLTVLNLHIIKIINKDKKQKTFQRKN